jgi:hypothetical protein
VTQAAADDVWLVTEPLAGGAELPTRLLKITATEITHLHLLQVPPDAFFRVHLRGVAGEALQVEPRGGPIAEKLPDGLAPVKRRAIPDNQQFTRDEMPQMSQKADHLSARDGRLVDLEVEPLVQAHGPDHREMITAEGVMQDRGLAHGSVGADHRGPEIEAALIQEEQGAILLSGLLF